MAKLIDTPSKNSWEDWKKQPWASRTAKRKENFKSRPDEEWDWKANHRYYESSPERYIADTQKQLNDDRTNILKALASGGLIKAERSDNLKLVAMQEMINQMAHSSNQFGVPPKLVIHTPLSNDEWAKELIISAAVPSPDFIEINEYTKEYFITHPNACRVIMAHELGHIANGDITTKNKAISDATPPSLKREVLADRMGAVIYGNPREYARIASDIRFSKKGVDPYAYSQLHASPSFSARMLHKWADILEKEGVTDKTTGEIINREKALKVFEKSKKSAEYLLSMDNGIRRR